MIKKISILLIFLLLLLSTSLFAYWSDSQNITYKNGDNYSQDMGIKPIPKTTDDQMASFQGYNKSTWSTPKVKLVNSNKEDRSGEVSLPDNYIHSTKETTTTKNYYYYYKINGAWNQITTGTMYFRYDPY